MLKPAVVEFSGVFCLTFMVTVARGGSLQSFGMCLFLLYAAITFAVQRVSSGQLNPALSISLLLARGTTFGRAIGLFIAQVAGSLAGGFAAKAIGRSAMPTLMPGNFVAGAVCEVMIAFAVAFAFCSLTLSPTAPKFVLGTSIAGILLAYTLVTYRVSGACGNLIFFLGPAIANMRFGIEWAIYPAAHIFGSALACLAFGLFTKRTFQPKDDSTVEEALSEVPPVESGRASQSLRASQTSKKTE